MIFQCDFLYVSNDVSQLQVMQPCHDFPLHDHFGTTETLGLIDQYYYWPCVHYAINILYRHVTLVFMKNLLSNIHMDFEEHFSGFHCDSSSHLPRAMMSLTISPRVCISFLMASPSLVSSNCCFVSSSLTPWLRYHLLVLAILICF